MGLHNLFNFNAIFPVGICILICTSLAESAPSVDPRYESCKPRNCGSGPNISYPFWILGTGTDHCGYPGFETSCEENRPILRTSQSRYIIQNISYTNQSFRLVDMDIIDTTCLTPHKLSFRSRFFKFGPNHASLLVFYNCPNSMALNLTISPLTCASNATHHAFVALVPGEQDWKIASLNCESKVAAPVELEEGQFNKTIEIFDYIRLLRNGFAVEWFEISCAECEKSGGRCGFNDKVIVCFCPDGPRPNHCSNGTTGRIKAAIGIAFSSAAGFGVLIFIVWYFKRKFSSDTCMLFWKKETQKHQNVVAFLRNYGSLAPKRYSYSNVKKMTNSFKDKLGQGGYGCVYKGNLHDGCLVAVKILNESKGNGEEFVNEVASISKTSHVNIVTLLGFCFEGSKRALIYEFMPNGSLEKFIYDGNKRQLGWETLYQIAIGIARGLEYLHRGCSTRILHFDIKPHNILLDEDFCPKVSDFGLAKLCPKKESIISMPRARGTAGYIAPEVLCRNFGGVSHKSDVYSYGMMVLEMVGGRKNIDIGADHTSEIYFPHWIHKRLERGDELGLHGIKNEHENERAKTMILVGLWCIQTDPSNRPPMGRVVEMLQGELGSLQIPPRPFLSSPPRSPQGSSI